MVGAGGMTPIERAARAIATEIGVDPDQLVSADDDAHVGLGLRAPHRAWTRYVGTARAALQAIREPSEEMQDAAFSSEAEFRTTMGNYERGYCDGATVWRAMIDAALDKGVG